VTLYCADCKMVSQTCMAAERDMSTDEAQEGAPVLMLVALPRRLLGIIGILQSLRCR
jgi:hypothetical protein